MILNSTHTGKKNREIIFDLIGKRYSFFESLKMGGIGSKRMIIEEVSPNLEKYLTKFSSLNYANIEMRPNGILIYINKGLETFTWIIPYYQFVFYKTNGATIHAQGKFIRFRNDITLHENTKFFKKLFQVKLKYDECFAFQNLRI